MRLLLSAMVYFTLLLRLYSQEYFNEIIPFIPSQNQFINSVELFQNKEDILITVIYPGVTSTIIKVNEVNEYEYIDVDNFVFAVNSLHSLTDGIIGYAKDREREKALLLAKFDNDFNVIWQVEIETEGVSNFPLSSVLLDGHVYLSFQITDEQSDRYFGVSKFDLDGNQIWIRYYFEGDLDFNNTYTMRSTKNNNLLISYARRTPPIGSSGWLTSIDTSGQINWTSEELIQNEGVVYQTELTDGRIVVSQLRDLIDVDSVRLCCDPITPSLKWLDNQGKVLHENLYLIKKFDQINISGIKAGQGDYFFSYGNYVELAPNSTITTYSGYITKHGNEGDTIWSRRFRHPDNDKTEVYHNIKDLIELDNGDIVAKGALGEIGDNFKIWFLKMDSNGCFNSNNCDSLVQVHVTSSVNTEAETTFDLFPNPTSGLINIKQRDGGTAVTMLELYDIRGNLLDQKSADFELLDIRGYPDGMYLVKIWFDDNSFIERVLKHKTLH